MANFDLFRPTANPFEVDPGSLVTISASIKAYVGGYVTVKLTIYEGSWLSGHGTLLDTLYQTVYFNVGQTKTVYFAHTAIEGTIDRRDVSITILDEFGILADDEWDDVFYVKEIPEPDLKVLDFEILGERAGGFISFSPPPLDAERHYVKGTIVYLTAIANPGFVFVKWRGEVDEPLSTSLTNTVTMSENRLVKAEFGLAEVEKYWPLEVDIEPKGGGYVTTSPPPIDIENKFTDGTIGKFIEDVRVKVTAYPNAGYEFWKWSDEIQGGVSFNPTEWVSGVMDEHKAVKAHFREIEVVPECTIDADCPIGYVCQNGVCVPEKPPPDEEEPEPEPDEEEGINWLPIVLIAGGGAVALFATTRSKKK